MGEEQKNWLELMTKQMQMTQVLDTNRYTEKFGLSLSQEDAALLAESRADALRREQRVEFGAGILPKIIEAFCDSASRFLCVALAFPELTL